MKRAQITLYILLGIVILAILALSAYLVTVYVISPASTHESAVQDYVESCVERVARQGLNSLGQRGGYLDITDPRLTPHTITTSTLPAEGDALPLSNDALIPYWWHMPTENDCTQCTLTRTNIPSLADMQRQLEHYLTLNLARCTDGFHSFFEQGYIVQSSRVAPTVQFTDTDVFIQIDWPLTIETPSGRTLHLTEFATHVDVPIKTLWQNANDLVSGLVETSAVESALMHLIASFSSVDFDKLPPIAAVTHGTHTVTWQHTLVEQTFTTILRTYTPLLQVRGARNTAPITVGDGPSQGVFDALTLDLTDHPIPYSVTFSILDWPIHFAITPHTDGRLAPEIDRTTYPQDLAPPFQTNYYEFFYDLSIPYLVTIRDPDALKGAGYEFIFAAEANIRDNKNMKEWNEGRGTVGPWDETRYALSQQTSSITAGECTCLANGLRTSAAQDCLDAQTTCSLTGQTHSNYTACLSACTRSVQNEPQSIIAPESLFCDDTFARGLATVRVRDAYTGRAVENADILYGCGSFATCTLGTTDRRGLLRDAIPFCNNGHLKTYLDGYYTNTQLHTAADASTDINITLIPLTSLRVQTRVYDMYNATDRSLIRESTLHPTEHVILTIERSPEQPHETPLVRFLTISPGSTPVLDLIPGTYNIRAQLIDERGYFLPKHCKLINIPDNPPRFVPDNDLTLRPGIRGGTVIDHTTFTHTIDIDSLRNASTITFPVLRQPAPTCIQADGCILNNCVGLEELERTAEFTLMHNETMRPALS